MDQEHVDCGCDSCTPSDSFDDAAWESLYEQIGKDCTRYGWDSADAMDAWKKGVAYKRDE